MKIDILTLFPEMFAGPFDGSIIKRAKEKGLVKILTHNIRDYAIDKHKTVDDTPYGGGAGMLMKVDVIVTALEAIVGHALPKKVAGTKILLLSAKGEPFHQKRAQSFASCKRLVLICGHYEGIDERLLDFIDGELSVGNYVLTGGELGAMIVADAVVRLIPGVIREASQGEESFSQENLLEYPQYTKPQNFRGRKVPAVLLSGDHAKIVEWRKEKQKQR